MIAVPYHLGIRNVEVGRGPLLLCNAAGRVVERRTTAIGELDAIADVNTQLARAVAGHAGPPIVLAGNCNSCAGTLAGLNRDDLGIVWFDAHGDFNTPETSISGNIEGMSLAIATGGCHDELRHRIGLEQPIPEERVLLVATRSLDPAEAVRLERSAVRVIPLEGLTAALDALDAAAVYVHLDIDVLDPRISPGVNFSTPGGITPDQLYKAVRTVAARIPIAAAAIANFNPDRDPDRRTLKIAQKLVAILGEVSLS
jgi:arginase